MLNIAGPEYDFGSVVFVVLEECEHRRPAIDDDVLESELTAIARGKLAQVKAAYDEFGGSRPYWEALENEVLHSAVPRYVKEAETMNRLERTGFGVWRRGDVAARFAFALCGLILGSIIIAVPFIPIFEVMFAFGLTVAGFFYPDIQRYVCERRHARFMNAVIRDSAEYQTNAKLHYMTTEQIRASFTPGVIDVSPSTEAPAEIASPPDPPSLS